MGPYDAALAEQEAALSILGGLVNESLNRRIVSKSKTAHQCWNLLRSTYAKPDPVKANHYHTLLNEMKYDFDIDGDEWCDRVEETCAKIAFYEGREELGDDYYAAKMLVRTLSETSDLFS